jgi:hypothetical protein
MRAKQLFTKEAQMTDWSHDIADFILARESKLLERDECYSTTGIHKVLVSEISTALRKNK